MVPTKGKLLTQHFSIVVSTIILLRERCCHNIVADVQELLAGGETGGPATVLVLLMLLD